jgi:8-oxo-dGTP pyrophosphatase MutT (NUDIX family)
VLPTDLTVSSVVEKDDHFLIVEERASGRIVLNQPGGHIEAGESPEDAARREALEETGCDIRIDGLLGVYLWINPQTRQNFLRIVYAGELVAHDPARTLDDVIHAVHWLAESDLERRRGDLRTPVVLHSIRDYLAGTRQPTTLLERLMPVEQNVHEVLANALLV